MNSFQVGRKFTTIKLIIFLQIYSKAIPYFLSLFSWENFEKSLVFHVYSFILPTESLKIVNAIYVSLKKLYSEKNENLVSISGKI